MFENLSRIFKVCQENKNDEKWPYSSLCIHIFSYWILKLRKKKKTNRHSLWKCVNQMWLVFFLLISRQFLKIESVLLWIWNWMTVVSVIKGDCHSKMEYAIDYSTNRNTHTHTQHLLCFIHLENMISQNMFT